MAEVRNGLRKRETALIFISTDSSITPNKKQQLSVLFAMIAGLNCMELPLPTAIAINRVIFDQVTRFYESEARCSPTFAHFDETTSGFLWRWRMWKTEL